MNNQLSLEEHITILNDISKFQTGKIFETLTKNPNKRNELIGNIQNLPTHFILNPNDELLNLLKKKYQSENPLINLFAIDTKKGNEISKISINYRNALVIPQLSNSYKLLVTPKDGFEIEFTYFNNNPNQKLLSSKKTNLKKAFFQPNNNKTYYIYKGNL